jgi:Ca-activated chloride channel family protein
MTNRVSLAAVLVAATVSTFSAQQQQGSAPPPQAPTFAVATQTVAIYATVLDRIRLVTDLPREVFDVYDDGVKQDITLFSNETQPISIVIMLDMSGSMTGNLALLRAGAVQLFTELQPADKARVGSFADSIILNDRFTNDQNELIHALYLDLPQTGVTPLWGAISLGMSALSKVDGRRVVLVFTDGYNTAPQPTLQEVIYKAQAQEYMVYGIGLWTRTPYGGLAPPDPGLRTLTEESGGGYFELRSTQGLGDAFKRVADELHRQYLLGFKTTHTDGKLHRIEVRVKPGDYIVRARKSYVAPRSTS